MREPTDILIHEDSSIFLFHPMSEVGQAWLDEHTPQDDEHQYLGPSLAVELRYAFDLAVAMVADGLTVRSV